MADEFVTTEIDARSHVGPALEAIRCHKTQWRAERMEEVHGMYANFFGGKVYLRLAMSRLPVRPALPRETSLFDGL